MSWIFDRAAAFNQPLGSWDVSKVTSMSNVFDRAAAFAKAINCLGWSKQLQLEEARRKEAERLRRLELEKKQNEDAIVTQWKCSKCQCINVLTEMQCKDCFADRHGRAKDHGDIFNAFNQPLGSWDVSKVTNIGIGSVTESQKGLLIKRFEEKHDLLMSFNLPKVLKNLHSHSSSD